MTDAEQGCHNNCGGPEANAVSQSIQKVTAEKIFFEQPHKKEPYSPLHSKPRNVSPMQGKGTEAEAVKQINYKEADGERQEAPEKIADPKASDYRLAVQWQAVICHILAFDARHDERSQNQEKEGQHFSD